MIKNKTKDGLKLAPKKLLRVDMILLLIAPIMLLSAILNIIPVHDSIEMTIIVILISVLKRIHREVSDELSYQSDEDGRNETHKPELNKR